LDNESTKITQEHLNKLKENTIYPNPFEDYFIVNSLQDDVFILQSLAGAIIGQYKVGKGETKITTNLSRGVYIGRLQKQSQTFKIVKQ